MAFEKSRRKKLERMVKENPDVIYDMINKANVYYFNQGLISDSVTDKSKVFTRSLRENAVWNQGQVEELEWFYKNQYQKMLGFKNDSGVQTSYFWYKVTPKTVRVHSGIPALISKTMVNMIAGPGMSYTVNEVEDVEVSQDTERLHSILTDNKFQEVLLPNGVNMTSYGGYLGWKINYDKEVSQYPILEFVKPENVEVVQKRGRTYKVIFKSIFEKNDDTYELHEIYSRDENSVPIMYYEMYKYDGADLITVDINESEYPTVVYNGLEDMPAGIINNTAINQQFKGSPYGQSDYANSQSLFNAIDENLSQTMTAERFARPKRWFSKDLLPTTPTGKKAEFDDFEVDYEVVNSDPDNAIQNQYREFDAKQDFDKFTSIDKLMITKAVTNAGLSLTSLGVPGFESIDQSADSQREKEKTSYRTREVKLKIWREELKHIFTMLLMMEDLMNGSETVGEYETTVNFNDYGVPTFEQRVKVANETLAGGTASIRTALDIAWLDDKSDDWKDEEANKIAIETGVPNTTVLEDENGQTT